MSKTKEEVISALEEFNKGMATFSNELTSGLTAFNEKMEQHLAERESDENVIRKKRKLEDFKRQILNN
ncbi:hypothetical protein [Vibrio sp. VB16]|uniref:hypothetical protein n=1 Tax=Vibrio sp. VB16 TaxID=2785746 RepID=UPI00189DA7E1|nr:hypothetical protein [Vibrio sp. VB16]UGA53560.1 hypothetical protein IUZ65_009615 [Vibrio sp. VB16]